MGRVTASAPRYPIPESAVTTEIPSVSKMVSTCANSTAPVTTRCQAGSAEIVHLLHWSRNHDKLATHQYKVAPFDGVLQRFCHDQRANKATAIGLTVQMRATRECKFPIAKAEIHEPKHFRSGLYTHQSRSLLATLQRNLSLPSTYSQASLETPPAGVASKRDNPTIRFNISSCVGS